MYRSTILGKAVVLGLVLVLASVAAHAVPASWTAPGGGVYSDPNNWSTSVAPCNVDIVEFEVTIPASRGTVTLDVADCVVASLSLGDNTTLANAAGDFQSPDRCPRRQTGDLPLE